MYTAAYIMTNSLPHVLQGDWNVLHALCREYGAELPFMLVCRCAGRLPIKNAGERKNTLNIVSFISQYSR